MGWGPSEYRYTVYPSYAITPPARRGLRFSREEYKHVLLAVGALIAAFTLAFLNLLAGPPYAGAQDIARIVIGATVAVVTGFFLHELAHKALAQRYGAWAEFRSSRTGLIFAIVTGFIGIVFAAPGAVYIAGPLSREQNGKVSLIGPLTNFGIALVSLGAWSALGGFFGADVWFYLGAALFFTAYINAFLGVFNMLPVPPLDGSKVFAWNVPLWAASIVGMGAVLAAFLLRLFLP